MIGVIPQALAGTPNTTQMLLAMHVLIERWQAAHAPGADPDAGDPTVERVQLEARAMADAIAQAVPVHTARRYLALGDIVTRGGS